VGTDHPPDGEKEKSPKTQQKECRKPHADQDPVAVWENEKKKFLARKRRHDLAI